MTPFHVRLLALVSEQLIHCVSKCLKLLSLNTIKLYPIKAFLRGHREGRESDTETQHGGVSTLARAFVPLGRWWLDEQGH